MSEAARLHDLSIAQAGRALRLAPADFANDVDRGSLRSALLHDTVRDTECIVKEKLAAAGVTHLRPPALVPPTAA